MKCHFIDFPRAIIGYVAIVGREKEIQELERIYRSEEAEFLAVYGRRRIGKTF